MPQDSTRYLTGRTPGMPQDISQAYHRYATKLTGLGIFRSPHFKSIIFRVRTAGADGAAILDVMDEAGLG